MIFVRKARRMTHEVFSTTARGNLCCFYASWLLRHGSEPSSSSATASRSAAEMDER